MIELRYFQQSDFQQLIEWIDTPEFLLQFAGPNLNFPLNNEQLENYLMSANEEGSKSFIYAIMDKQSKKVIGHISLSKIDYEKKSARISKVLLGDPNSRGKGLCPLVINEVLKIAFNDLNLQKVGLVVFDFNTSAIACYEKVGFTKEHFMKDVRKMGDEYWSLYEMTLLKKDWNR